MQNINAVEAKKLLDAQEAIIIDVRENEEYSAEHIQGALHVPLAEVAGKIESINTDKKIIFQCRSGGRGGKACEVAKNFIESENIFNLEGGITAWKAAGYKVESASSGKACSISIFRQVQIIVGALILIFIMLGISSSPIFLYFAVGFSAALFFAGLTGWCGLAMALQKMPWNKIKVENISENKIEKNFCETKK
jgi:rhodanese-related sulfurtransferase